MKVEMRQLARALAFGFDTVYTPEEALKHMDALIDHLNAMRPIIRSTCGLAEDGVPQYAHYPTRKAYAFADIIDNLEDNLYIQRDKMTELAKPKPDPDTEELNAAVEAKRAGLTNTTPITLGNLRAALAMVGGPCASPAPNTPHATTCARCGCAAGLGHGWYRIYNVPSVENGHREYCAKCGRGIVARNPGILYEYFNAVGGLMGKGGEA